MSDTTNEPTPTDGAWVLVDRDLGGLFIGDRQLTGQSIRRLVDAPGRRLLVPALRHVATTGEPYDLVELFGDRWWKVHAVPVRTPRSGELIAVLGVIHTLGTSPAEQPLIGGWEFDGPATGKSVISLTYERSDWWDDRMWRVHGLDQPTGGDGRGAWSPSLWLTEVVAPEDRVPLKVLFTEFALNPDGLLHTVSYHGSHRYGSPEASVVAYRIAGYSARDEATGRASFRALLYRLPDQPPVVADPPDVRTDDFLRAAFSLARAALMVVETRMLTVGMLNEVWAEIGLPPLVTGFFPNLVRPDSVAGFVDYLLAAVSEPGVVQPEIVIPLLREDGAYAPFAIAGTGIFTSDGREPRFVMCRVRPASGSPEGAVDSELIGADLLGELSQLHQ